MVAKDLVAYVAKEAKITNKDADQAIKSVFDGIVGALAKGDKVLISGFGIFEVKETKARKGVNPATQAKIDIPASKRVTFRVSKTLKEAIK